MLLEQEKLKGKRERKTSKLPKNPQSQKGTKTLPNWQKSRPTETVPVVKKKQTQSPAFTDANRHKATHSDNLV